MPRKTPAMRLSIQTIARLGLLTSIALATTGSTWAADEPERRPSPTPPQQELIPVLPDLSDAPVDVAVSDALLRLLEAPAVGPDDKGSTYTDMGAGLEGRSVLTAGERALLDLARLAIEASRAAGTLEVSGPPEQQTAVPLDAAALKLARLQSPVAGEPVPGSGGPYDVIGAPAANDFVGPIEPTAEELAKLEKLHATHGETPTSARTEVK